MRVYRQYLIILALTLGALDVALAFFRLNDLSLYFIFNLVLYLIITLLFTYLNPHAKRALNGVSIVAFMVFCGIVVYKAIEVINGK